MKNAFSSLSDLAAAMGHEVKEDEQAAKPTDEDLVYSTDGGKITRSKEKAITPSDGFAKVRRETKGRKGKGVTVISGLGIDEKALKKPASQLKKQCGSGGSVVGETIEVQGDKKEQVKTVLEKNGFKVKFVGG